jgi:hypothetical protein
MKISSDTIGVLQNFASINNGLQVKAGNVLQTISPNKTVLASAVVSETFDDFCVYDLSQFLGTLSLFNDPEVEFNSDHATIADGNSKVKYVYADPNTIVTVPDRELEITADIKVVIKKENLQKAIKAANVLGLPNIVIAGDQQGDVELRATDVKNSTSNQIAVALADEDVVTTPEHAFSMVFRLDNLKIIQDDYVVGISQQGISEFVGNTARYFVAVEQADSKFN